MKVSIKKAKQIGFFAAVCMLIGSVVGIGIFFKNNSIFKINEFNEIGVVISWLVAALIAITTAISFAIFGFSKNKEQDYRVRLKLLNIKSLLDLSLLLNHVFIMPHFYHHFVSLLLKLYLK